MASCAFGQLSVGHGGRLERSRTRRPLASVPCRRVFCKALRPVSAPSTVVHCLFGDFGGFDFGSDHTMDSGIDHSFDHEPFNDHDVGSPHDVEQSFGREHSPDQLQGPKYNAFGTNAFDFDMMAAGMFLHGDTASRTAKETPEHRFSTRKVSRDTTGVSSTQKPDGGSTQSSTAEQQLNLDWPPFSWLALKLLLLGACVASLRHCIGAKGKLSHNQFWSCH